MVVSPWLVPATMLFCCLGEDMTDGIVQGIVLADAPRAFELEIHRPYIGSRLDIPASRLQDSGQFSLSEAVEICRDLPKRNANGLHPTFYFSAHWGRLGYDGSEAGISCIDVEAWDHAWAAQELWAYAC